MRKKMFLIVVSTVLAMTCCSVGSNGPVDEATTLKVDVSSIDVPAEGGKYVVNMTVNGPATGWQSIVPSDGCVTVTPDKNLQPYTGNKMSVALRVCVEENRSEDSRTREICLFTQHDRHVITVNQAPFEREGCVEFDKPEINFEINHYEYRPVAVTAYEDVEIKLPDNTWLQTAEMPEGIVKANTSLKFYVAPDGPTTQHRSAAITFTGKKTGKTGVLNISQDPINISGSFPARWYYTNSEAQNSGWQSSGYAAANYDNGASSAIITAVGVNNRRLGHIIATTYKESTGVSNLYTGDYLLFSFPVKSLAAGTAVDFMLTISGNDNDAPKYWICEILDGGQWRKPEAKDLKQADGEDYSFYTRYFSSYQHCTFLQSFTLGNAVTDGMVQVRCRVMGKRNGEEGILSPANNGAVYLPSHEFHFCTMTAYPGIAEKDVKKVAILGNSFTHYFGSAFLLKEIARSQGHRLDVRAFAKGSQYLRNHMTLERSNDVMAESGYDYVILQEQSTTHDVYATSQTQTILGENKALTARFREKSPGACIVLENTWAYPKTNWNNYGSSEKFSSLLLAGAKAIAQADDNTDCVSPIGVAFNAAYNAGITDLWFTDSKHPNRNGAYLKSCVNYLMIYGEPFDDNASNGGCDPVVAAKLRCIAEQTVLGHESEYLIKR